MWTYLGAGPTPHPTRRLSSTVAANFENTIIHEVLTLPICREYLARRNHEEMSLYASLMLRSKPPRSAKYLFPDSGPANPHYIRGMPLEFGHGLLLSTLACGIYAWTSYDSQVRRAAAYTVSLVIDGAALSGLERWISSVCDKSRRAKLEYI